jgi:hypothetical protein
MYSRTLNHLQTATEGFFEICKELKEDSYKEHIIPYLLRAQEWISFHRYV